MLAEIPSPSTPDRSGWRTCGSHARVRSGGRGWPGSGVPTSHATNAASLDPGGASCSKEGAAAAAAAAACSPAPSSSSSSGWAARTNAAHLATTNSAGALNASSRQEGQHSWAADTIRLIWARHAAHNGCTHRHGRIQGSRS